MANVKISELGAASTLTGEELVEIVQSGTNVRSTITGIKNGAVKVYRALLTQSGSSAPSATVLENTLGGTVVWGRTSAGIYTATLASAFSSSKTYASIENVVGMNAASPSLRLATIEITSTSILTVRTDVFDLVTPASSAVLDGVLSMTCVTVLVYP